MKRFFVFFLLPLMLTMALLSSAKPRKAMCRYVTQVDVHCQIDGQSAHIRYTDPEKMEAMLLHRHSMNHRGLEPRLHHVPVRQRRIATDVQTTIHEGTNILNHATHHIINLYHIAQTILQRPQHRRTTPAPCTNGVGKNRNS